MLRCAQRTFCPPGRHCPIGAASRNHRTWRCAGQRKQERGTRAIVSLSPQSALVTLDNAATDGQANAHSATLGGVKGVKKFMCLLGIEPGPRVADGYMHMSF